MKYTLVRQAHIIRFWVKANNLHSIITLVVIIVLENEKYLLALIDSLGIHWNDDH